MKKPSRRYVRLRIEDMGSLSRWLSAWGDFFILNVSFFLVHYIRLGRFRISGDHVNLLLLFYFLWLFISSAARKFRVDSSGHRQSMVVQVKAALALLYGISFCVVFFRFPAYSRIQIFGTCLLMLVLEVGFFSALTLGRRAAEVPHGAGRKAPASLRFGSPGFLLLSDFILLNAAFFALNLFKRSSLALAPDHSRMLLLLYGLWITGAVLTRKYYPQNFHNIYHSLAAHVKAIVFMALSVSAIMFALEWDYFSRLHILGTLLLFCLMESVHIYFYFIMKFVKEPAADIESAEAAQNFFGQMDLSFGDTPRNPGPAESPSFMGMLIERCLKSLPGLHEFVSKAMDLTGLNQSEATIINSPEFLELDILKDESVRLLINLHKINDIRRINRYLLEAHRRLMAGGYLLGMTSTIGIHKKRFFKKYPRYFAEMLYTLHFMFHRVLPKLPEVRKVYFALTKGKNRMISRAEVLGRLSYCGFSIAGEREIEGSLFFIAQKTKSPCLDQTPSYGPLIRLKRVGLHGRTIEVYKFRTMYPYSEYLQEYIYRNQRLSEGGKIRSDFRVTDWGGFIRKYWLDELPMLMNWLKGDIKLFGVRPLSAHYLSLYDEYVQKLREKVKPGLVPPYYADLPREMQEISNSEKNYIESYIKHPLRTQCQYFMRVIGNILFKGARSS